MSVAENDVAPSRASGNITLRLHFTITAKFGSSPPCYCDCCLPKQFVLQNDVTWECPGESPKVELPPTAPALPSEDCAFLIEVLGKLAPGERRWINFPDDRNGKKAKELWGDPKKYKIHGPYCYGEPPVYPPNYSGAKEDALGEAYSDCEAWWRDSPAFTIDPSNRKGCKFTWVFRIAVEVFAKDGCTGGDRKEFKMTMVGVVEENGTVDPAKTFVR